MFNLKCFIFLSLLWASTVYAGTELCAIKFDSSKPSESYMTFQDAKAFTQKLELTFSVYDESFYFDTYNISIFIFRLWLNSTLRPKNFPRSPEMFYKTKKEWKGWRDFLGIPNPEEVPSDIGMVRRAARDEFSTQLENSINRKKMQRAVIIDPDVFFKWWAETKDAIAKGEIDLDKELNDLVQNQLIENKTQTPDPEY